MNIGLLHPIAEYIFWSFIGIAGPAWVLDMTTILKLRSRKFRNEEIIVGLAYLFYLLVILFFQVLHLHFLLLQDW